MHGVETNMKSPKNPNDIIAMQLNGVCKKRMTLMSITFMRIISL